MDIINIEGLVVYANHGVLPEENRLGQKFIISAKLWFMGTIRCFLRFVLLTINMQSVEKSMSPTLSARVSPSRVPQQSNMRNITGIS